MPRGRQSFAQVRRSLRALPNDVQAEVKQVADRQAEQLAARIRAARDTRMSDIVFGAEFGGNNAPQFRRMHRQSGYWFFPTVDRYRPVIWQAWKLGVDHVLLRVMGG